MNNELSKKEVRDFLVRYHNLDGSQGYAGEKGIHDYINRVGCIQYDPLNVVGRNSDLVMQSRIENYDSEMLYRLLYKERSLIDGWDKMMAIYCLEDFKYFTRVRKAKEIEVKNTLIRRHSIEAIDYVSEIKDMIINNGPLQSNQITIGKSREGRWGHKKFSSATLDYMFNKGELGIYDKKNTQKVYEVIERLYAAEILSAEDPFKTDWDFYKWYVKRRIGSIGVLWNKNGGGWLGQYLSNKKLREEILEELVEEKSIFEFKIKDIKASFYIRKEDIGLLNKKSNQKQARFLAPLDNLLWDRKMISELFNFDYSWEVYVPIEKRKYGYYVLPILYDGRLVGRFEPEVYRGKGKLQIKNWWWEKNYNITGEMKSVIIEAYVNFCSYLNTEDIDIKEVEKLW